jgi:hypothetical protein
MTFSGTSVGFTTAKINFVGGSFGKQAHRNFPNYIRQLSASTLPSNNAARSRPARGILGPIARLVSEPADSGYRLPGILRGGKEGALACNFR